MAELDARLAPILDAVERSALAPFAASARRRLEAAENQVWTLDGEHDPLAPRPDETRDDRARRQLKLLDEVIGGRLRLELDLWAANARLSRQISDRLDVGRREAFATVMLVTEADAESGEGRVAGEDLITGARRERMERVLDIWKSIVGAADDGLGARLET